MKTTHSRKPRQLHLLKPGLRFFGGLLLHGRRRSRRPLSTKDPIHLVLRSSWALGPYSFLRKENRLAIERAILQNAKRYGVRIYQQAIASNHIHLVMKISNRELYKVFIRVLSSQIASHIMKGMSFEEFMRERRKAKAGDPQRTNLNVKSNDLRPPNSAARPGDPPEAMEIQGKGQAFWQFRPFSRVLHWGRDFKTCCAYVMQNTLEALGFIAYTPRPNNKYAKWIKDTISPFMS